MPTSDSIPFVPGFSNDQVQGLMALFQGIIRTEMATLRTEIRTKIRQLRNEFRQQFKEEQCSMERIAETVSSSSDTTGLLSTVSHQSTQPATQPVTQSATQPEHSVEQEEEPLQAIAENTAEKPSGNKATIVKNMAQLSTMPRQIITQQTENTTTIWPTVSTCLGNITL